MYEKYSKDAEIFVVYIKEAHPSDGWQMNSNKRAKVIFKQPTTFAERLKVAKSCEVGLKLSMPIIVDGIDNAVEELYSGWPERIYVIDLKGKITYKGEIGPRGFHPEEGEAALRKLLGLPELPAGNKTRNRRRRNRGGGGGGE